MASLALTGYSVSPGLSLMIGRAFPLGLGSGAIDSGLNAYAAGAFGPRHMNWMHAFFGLGVALGPLIMTTVMGVHLAWRWGTGSWRARRPFSRWPSCLQSGPLQEPEGSQPDRPATGTP